MVLAPLRSFDEFVGRRASFKAPDFKEPGGLDKRIKKNLLYYQTNYFVLNVGLYVIFAVTYLYKALAGMFTLSISILTYKLLTEKPSQNSLLRSRFLEPLHSVVGNGAAADKKVIIASVVISVFSVLLFWTDLLAVILVILIGALVCMVHAAYRKLNVATQISSFRSQLERSPMYTLLATLDSGLDAIILPPVEPRESR